MRNEMESLRRQRTILLKEIAEARGEFVRTGDEQALARMRVLAQGFDANETAYAWALRRQFQSVSDQGV
ncbi:MULTISPECIES: hypothetical protein [unclassified Streptomyces]|uniref:hypothetical protein n=1 Tax=unclassified Streptomyces TaxID=2593676 RepID=UPI003651F4CE